MGWLIAAGIILAIIILLFIPIKVRIKLEDGLNIDIYWIVFKKGIYPEKEEKYKLQKLGPHSLKEEIGPKKKKYQKRIFDDLKNEVTKKGNAADSLKEITSILSYFIKKLQKILYIKIKTLDVNVSTDDAAKTAVEYGALSMSYSYLMNFLYNKTKLVLDKKGNMGVRADFVSNTNKITVNADISVLVLPIALIASALGLFNKITKTISDNESEEEQNG